MKVNITVEVECTPAEARAVWGVPDIKPIQDAITHQVADGIERTGALSPLTLMYTWMSPWLALMDQIPVSAPRQAPMPTPPQASMQAPVRYRYRHRWSGGRGAPKAGLRSA